MEVISDSGSLWNILALSRDVRVSLLSGLGLDALVSLQQVQHGNIMLIDAILRALLSIRHEQAWLQKFFT